MKKKAIFQKIIDWIENGIQSRKFLPGGELPSEKELCERFNTSRASVRKAFERLERTQTIFRKPGIGSFVRDINSLESNHILNIGISSLSYCDWYTADIFAGASAACTQVNAQLVYVDIDEYLSTKRVKLDGLIVLYGADIVNMETLDKLSASEVPVALLNRFTDQSHISYFSVDYEKESAKAVNFLRSQNAHKIAAVLAENDSIYALKTRLRGYDNACRELGMKPAYCKVTSPVTATKQIQDFMLASDCDGLFLTSQAVLTPAIEAYNNIATLAGRKIPMLCFDKLPHEVASKSDISSIEMPLHEIAFSAVKHLVERSRNQLTPITRKIYNTCFVVNSASFEIEESNNIDFDIKRPDKNNKEILIEN